MNQTIELQPFPKAHLEPNIAHLISVKHLGLPGWLIEPLIIDNEGLLFPVELFSDWLHPDLLSAIKNKYESLLTVQKLMFDNISKSKEADINDVVLCAPTGSGKTLCYVVPLINSILKNKKCNRNSIILVPNILLGNQIKKFIDQLKIEKIETYITQENIDVDNELNIINKKFVDIVISTPQRLSSLILSEDLCLKNVRYFIIDEFDSILKNNNNINQAKHVKFIATHLSNFNESSDNIDRYSVYPFRQKIIKMLFSATITTNIKLYDYLDLYDPSYLLVSSLINPQKDEIIHEHRAVIKRSIPLKLTEYKINCPKKSRYGIMLLLLISQIKLESTIVFVNCDILAKNLAVEMQKSLDSLSHAHTSGKFNRNSQENARELALNSRNKKIDYLSSKSKVDQFDIITQKFEKKEINILILSSLISRGLDLNPSHVINYDTPISINNYLHQVGRTARATNIGTAYTFVDYTKIKTFNGYIKKIDHSISPLYFPQYKEFMDELNKICDLELY